jgi:glycerophosphoryl diester phosphodiesterase
VTQPDGAAARPIVCAHRGASLSLPDNSIEAFEAAIASGCEMIETDVRVDRHGRPVLSHDRLRPISPGNRHGRPRSRRSSSRPRPRPRRSRPAATAPVTLEALLELSAGRIGLDLEIKEARVVPALLDAIAGWDGTVLLTSFDPAAIRAVRQRDPSRATGLIAGPMHIGDPLTDALACDAQALVLAERRLTAKLLASPSPSLALALWVWTVNQPARLTRWLSEPALRGVITDDPVTAVAVRDGLARDGTDLT